MTCLHENLFRVGGIWKCFRLECDFSIGSQDETPAELREDAEYYRHNRDVMGAEWEQLRQLLIRFVISWESLPGHKNMDRLCEIARGLGCVPSAQKTSCEVAK